MSQPTFRGKILCKQCKTVLNVSGEPVYEHEKSWCERQSFVACKPNCTHVREADSYKAHGWYFDREVVWEPWETEQVNDSCAS